jgi:hypothetical protein
MLMRKKSWPELAALTSIFFVELPGIEPGAETALTCEDDGIEYEKRRQKTRNDLRIQPSC